MPDDVTPQDEVTDPSAMPDPNQVLRTSISVEIRRVPGRAPTLVMDTSAFHEHLQRLGVRVTSGEFENIPGSRAAMRGGRVLPYALLTGVGNQPRTYSLAEAFSGSATFQNLMDLAYSVDTCAKEVIEHYRPVEIKLRLVDKK